MLSLLSKSAWRQSEPPLAGAIQTALFGVTEQATDLAQVQLGFGQVVHRTFAAFRIQQFAVTNAFACQVPVQAARV